MNPDHDETRRKNFDPLNDEYDPFSAPPVAPPTTQPNIPQGNASYHHYSEPTQSRRVTVYEPECVYYLAPSSIPNSGFGTYTVRDTPQNTLLMQQADAPTIVLSDIHNHFQRNTFILWWL